MYCSWRHFCYIIGFIYNHNPITNNPPQLLIIHPICHSNYLSIFGTAVLGNTQGMCRLAQSVFFRLFQDYYNFIGWIFL